MRTHRANMSLRDVTIAQDGKRRLASANDIMHQKHAEDFERFWKNQWVEMRPASGKERLAFACSRRPLWRCHTGWVGEMKNKERLCLSLLMSKTFTLKGNKKFRTWTKKSLRVFWILRFLCSIFMDIWCTFHTWLWYTSIQYNYAQWSHNDSLWA